MNNIQVDTSITYEGGFHPAIISDGEFKGVAFIVNKFDINDEGMVSFEYNIVKGDIKLNQQDSFEKILKNYIKETLEQIIKEDNNLDH
jgi:hypothetical protein